MSNRWKVENMDHMDLSLTLHDFLLLLHIKRFTAAMPTAELREAFPEMSRTQIYKRLDRLRKRGLIETYRMKTLPAYSGHMVSDAGVALIRAFHRKYMAVGK